MDNREDIAVSWMKYAMKWSDRFESSTLSDPAASIISKLNKSTSDNELRRAWEYIRDLQRLSESTNEQEAAEICLNCGLAAAEMHDFHEAHGFFFDAVKKFVKHKHQQTVAQWMNGCALWLLPDKSMEAISAWQASIKIFESLSTQHKRDVEPHRWYEQRCVEMCDALHQATQEYKIPPLPEGARAWVNEPKTKENPPPHNDDPSQNNASVDNDRFSNRLRSIPVYDHISAGNFDASGILEQPVSHLEVDQVIIEDVPHRIHSLTGRRVVNLPDSQEYYILRVTGNSMNNAKPVRIEPGDYVLMRQQPSADDGNIVAAEIIREDPQATLKRYRLRSGDHILEPESSDTNWQTRILMRDKFFIRGIALAVFKKIQD